MATDLVVVDMATDLAAVGPVVVEMEVVKVVPVEQNEYQSNIIRRAAYRDPMQATDACYQVCA
jgi:hypothetical protein